MPQYSLTFQAEALRFGESVEDGVVDEAVEDERYSDDRRMSFDDLEEARSDVYSLQVLNNFYFTNIFHKLDQIFSSLCLLNANESSTPSSQENDMIVAILNELIFQRNTVDEEFEHQQRYNHQYHHHETQSPNQEVSIICRCLFLPSKL